MTRNDLRDTYPFHDMRPNRVTFYLQGRESARMGNARSPGNEYRIPVFGCGKSWQARAFARGFRDECASQGHAVIEE